MYHDPTLGAKDPNAKLAIRDLYSRIHYGAVTDHTLIQHPFEGLAVFDLSTHSFWLYTDAGGWGDIFSIGGEPLLTAHVADTTDAHDASAVSFANSGTTLAASDVQAAIAEIDDEIRGIQVKVIDDVTTLTTGDAKVILCVPAFLNGMNLIDADAYVTTAASAAAPTIQIRNVTQAADMLSTRITIDVAEFTSYTAATSPVIDTANDDVATGDLLAVDVDVAGTGAKGLGVILQFGI